MNSIIAIAFQDELEKLAAKDQARGGATIGAFLGGPIGGAIGAAAGAKKGRKGKAALGAGVGSAAGATGAAMLSGALLSLAKPKTLEGEVARTALHHLAIIGGGVAGSRKGSDYGK